MGQLLLTEAPGATSYNAVSEPREKLLKAIGRRFIFQEADSGRVPDRTRSTGHGNRVIRAVCSIHTECPEQERAAGIR